MKEEKQAGSFENPVNPVSFFPGFISVSPGRNAWFLHLQARPFSISQRGTWPQPNCHENKKAADERR
ncbi:MAG TPA: hypothetical protein VM658_00330 [bacterium]|nr:hypothetical protein [bacterium]